MGELRRLLDGEEHGAVIGARMVGCSWSELAGALGVGLAVVQARFGELVARHEAAGLLPGDVNGAGGEELTR